MVQTNTNLSNSTLEEVRIAVRAIEDKKGEAIRVLDVRGKSSITDYIVIATGTSDPHLKALKSNLDTVLEKSAVALLGDDREVGSGWLVVDAFDFMVHLQTEAMREHYDLERLWKDAEEVVL